MPHPYVTSAAIKNNMIEISVEVDASEAGTYVEVSGSATQTGGAFANFYDIRQVPAADPNARSSDPDDAGKPVSFVYVSAHPLPPNKFRTDQDVSLVIRVGKVWLTVLGKSGTTGPSDPASIPSAGEGALWNALRRTSEITGDLTDKTSAS
jgi:hypothetical protein